MSVNALEKALWEASSNPNVAQILRDDCAKFTASYYIDEAESSLLQSWNVRGLVEYGVHPMLAMFAFAAVHGPAASAQYVMKINTPVGTGV